MSDLGILTKNTISPTGYSINGFSKEIAKARIKGNHDIPEIAASSRYIYDNLYKKLFDQVPENIAKLLDIDDENLYKFNQGLSPTVDIEENKVSKLIN